MPKDTSRSAYTRRIMEILVNIKKQKEEIGKVNLIVICLEINIQDCFVTNIVDTSGHEACAERNKPVVRET